VSISGDDAAFQKRYSAPTRESVINFLALDGENPNSILSCLRAARENARTVREVISSEMWEQVNTFYLMVRDAVAQERVLAEPHAFFTEVKMASHLFVGITDVTMSHNEGWHFGRLGCLLDRADKTSRLLDVKYYLLLPQVTDVGTSVDDIQWSAVLKSASAFEMYRKRFGRMRPDRVADFLMLDREFPRAMHYCLVQAEESLHAISGSPIGTFQNLAEQRLGRLRSELDYAQVDEIIASGLHEFLDAFQAKLNNVGMAIFETFVALRPVTDVPTPVQGSQMMQRTR